ncbi:hypothetical protein Tco_0413622 [Tanacetum coccineum]
MKATITWRFRACDGFDERLLVCSLSFKNNVLSHLQFARETISTTPNGSQKRVPDRSEATCVGGEQKKWIQGILVLYAEAFLHTSSCPSAVSSTLSASRWSGNLKGAGFDEIDIKNKIKALTVTGQTGNQSLPIPQGALAPVPRRAAVLNACKNMLQLMEEVSIPVRLRALILKIIMVNVIPPDHVDDVPVVELNQHDDVPVVPESILVDEEEDPEEEEFEEEEDPQEEEDDMEVAIEEDENEPELTYPYEEADPLNPLPPASDSEPDDVIEVEDTDEPEDETVPASVYEVGESSTAAAIPREDGDSLLPGFMRWDIDSLFGRIASISRRLRGLETAHALVEKKWKAKDKYYGKLIMDLGNEVHSSVEQGMATMKNLVRKVGNAKEKAKCKKLKKELEEERIMPPKSAPMTQAAIRRMIKESVDAAIAVEQARQANVRNDASGSGPVREGKKVKFAAATLQGPTLTWWNAKVATMGLETVNQMPWTEMKQLMTTEFCPIE